MIVQVIEKSMLENNHTALGGILSLFIICGDSDATNKGRISENDSGEETQLYSHDRWI